MSRRNRRHRLKYTNSAKEPRALRLTYRIMAKRKGFESIRMADKTKEFTTHRPSRRPAGARTPSPDEYRKEQLQKAQGMSKKKVVTTATVVKK